MDDKVVTNQGSGAGQTSGQTPPSDQTHSVNAEQLRAFVERFERLETEKKDITEAQKDVMSEAAAYGYDAKILRRVIVLRKKDPEKLSEEEAVLNLYRDVLGL